MLNVLFAGSPECAVPSLEAVARKHRITAVLTNPPSRSGRSGTLVPTAVHAAAQRLKNEGIIPQETPILTPEKITQEVRDAIAATKSDVLACFAYGKIFGPKTLSLFPLGALNLHPSLLPRWRGCAPIPAAILAGDQTTGITIQKMALEMDSGDIIIQKTIELDGSETAETLLERAAIEGAPLLVDALDSTEKGTVIARPQINENATYCTMLTKENGKINWKKSAREIDAQIRAFSPWPGAYTSAGEDVLLLLKARISTAISCTDKKDEPGTVIGIHKNEGILIQTGEGILALERLQWRTKKPLDWKSFLNGSQNFLQRTLT